MASPERSGHIHRELADLAGDDECPKRQKIIVLLPILLLLR